MSGSDFQARGLRVQARDSAMNIFASCLAAPEVAWRIALEWIEQCPGLTVELVSADA